jgi:phosphohistidine phosphatase SixA
MQLQLLYIARHAPAEEFNPQAPGQDSARRLTASGEALAHQVFGALQKLGHVPEHIYASPYARTARTAEIAREALKMRSPVETLPTLAPGNNRDHVRSILIECPYRSAMIVGHEPDVSGWISDLCLRNGNLAQFFERAGVSLLRVYELRGGIKGELVFHAPPTLLVTGQR